MFTYRSLKRTRAKKPVLMVNCVLSYFAFNKHIHDVSSGTVSGEESSLCLHSETKGCIRSGWRQKGMSPSVCEFVFIYDVSLKRCLGMIFEL